MIHFVGRSGSVVVGGGGGSTANVSFNPGGGSYAGTSLNVTIMVTGAVKLRWRINSGIFTTVSATSTVVSVSLGLAGITLSADALNANGSVLASNSAFYQKTDGGQ